MNAQWWDVRLTSDALDDFVGIIEWTTRNWGIRQTRIYEATIEDALDALHTGPDILGAQQQDNLALGIRTLHIARHGRKGRHFVVFRAEGDHVISVLRILYDGMDLSQHLHS